MIINTPFSCSIIKPGNLLVAQDVKHNEIIIVGIVIRKDKDSYYVKWDDKSVYPYSIDATRNSDEFTKWTLHT